MNLTDTHLYVIRVALHLALRQLRPAYWRSEEDREAYQAIQHALDLLMPAS